MNALALAVDPQVAYYSEETIPILIETAFRQALGLSLEANFLTDKNVEFLLVKTKAQAEKLKDQVTSKDLSIEFKTN